MITQSTKMKAITLILLMMVSAMAGCLGNDDDDDKDDTTDTGTNPGDGTNSTVNDTEVPDNSIDVGTIVCGPDGSISIAGSSTVLPLAEAWAEYYTEACEGVTITVESV